jgi:hypothetical protein
MVRSDLGVAGGPWSPSRPGNDRGEEHPAMRRRGPEPVVGTSTDPGSRGRVDGVLAELRHCSELDALESINAGLRPERWSLGVLT